MELRTIAGATTCTCFTRHRQAWQPNLAPGVYRVGTSAENGKRPEVHRTAAQRLPAAMLDPGALPVIQGDGRRMVRRADVARLSTAARRRARGDVLPSAGPDPLDTELLAWSPVMGPVEAVARDRAAEALELAR